MTSIRDAARVRVDTLVATLLDESGVVQAGGAAASGAELRARVEYAAGRAADRLFKRFKPADQAGWDKVFDLARQGNASPLEVLGHDDETPKHPVAKEVLGSLGSGWTLGRVVEQNFTTAPYGWSTDAIRGALLALMACGEVAAQVDGQSVVPKGIAPTSIGKTSFRREKDTVGPTQRIEVRGVLAKAGVHVPSGGEVAGVATLLERLESQSLLVAGHPPLPAAALPPVVETLKAKHGNEQLLAVLAEAGEIERCSNEIIELGKRRSARLPTYETAAELSAQATGLEAAQSSMAQLKAVQDQRSLLDEVDPISAVCRDLTDVLRAAIKSASLNHQSRLQEGLASLEGDAAWSALDGSQRSDLLSR